MSDNFSNLRLGTPITGLESRNFYTDNFTVVGLGFNWAVLVDDEGNIYPHVLEPSDEYKVGCYKEDETGSLEFIKEGDL